MLLCAKPLAAELFEEDVVDELQQLPLLPLAMEQVEAVQVEFVTLAPGQEVAMALHPFMSADPPQLPT